MKRRRAVERRLRLGYAPRVPIGPVARLYKADAMGIEEEELLTDVGWRLYARCQDVLLVGDRRVRCPECRTVFGVPPRRPAPDAVATCPGCGWWVTAAEFYYSTSGTDLDGHNARPVWAEFAERFPGARTYQERMLLIDRLIHGVHRSGAPAARNLFEDHPRQVLATLDALAGSRHEPGVTG